MSSIKINSNEKLIFAFSFLSFLISFVLIRLSGFSSSTVVNMENYMIRSIILQTSGSTLGAIYLFLSPFYTIILSLCFFVLGISILCYYGYSNKDSDTGKILGIVSGIFALILFPTIAGAFIALSVFVCCVYSTKLSNAYSKELKKWVFFRVGSNTTGRILFVTNIIIVVGIFTAILANQQIYAVSFRQDLTATMKSLAIALPGASAIPSDVLNERIASTVNSSQLIKSYIIWLPATTAFTVWVILEFLRNILLANIGGVFTYIMLRRNK